MKADILRSLSNCRIYEYGSCDNDINESAKESTLKSLSALETLQLFRKRLGQSKVDGNTNVIVNAPEIIGYYEI